MAGTRPCALTSGGSSGMLYCSDSSSRLSHKCCTCQTSSPWQSLGSPQSKARGSFSLEVPFYDQARGLTSGSHFRVSLQGQLKSRFNWDQAPHFPTGQGPNEKICSDLMKILKKSDNFREIISSDFPLVGSFGTVTFRGF